MPASSSPFELLARHSADQGPTSRARRPEGVHCHHHSRPETIPEIVQDAGRDDAASIPTGEKRPATFFKGVETDLAEICVR